MIAFEGLYVVPVLWAALVVVVVVVVVVGFFLLFVCLSLTLFRDYMQEIEASVVARLSTWKPQHLGIWVDIIEPPATPVKVASASELMELEDEAQAARFREVRTKLAADVASMCEFNSAKEDASRRSHVVKVMHEKSQVEAGKEPLGMNYVMVCFAICCVRFVYIC